MWKKVVSIGVICLLVLLGVGAILHSIGLLQGPRIDIKQAQSGLANGQQSVRSSAVAEQRTQQTERTTERADQKSINSVDRGISSQAIGLTSQASSIKQGERATSDGIEVLAEIASRGPLGKH